MDRNEAKKLMRVEMETKLSEAEQKTPIFQYQDRILNSIDVCIEAEIEPETPLGAAFIDDFIEYKEGKHSGTDSSAMAVINDPKFKSLGLKLAPETPLSPEQLALCISLMKGDLDLGGELFGNRVIYTENGVKWTPYMLFKEVQDGTPYGLAYAKTFLLSHEARQDLMEIGKLLGMDFSKVKIPPPPVGGDLKRDIIIPGYINLFGFGTGKGNGNDQKN